MSGALAVELDADGMREGASDILGSSEELLACCVATLLGEELPNRIRLERCVGSTLLLLLALVTGLLLFISRKVGGELLEGLCALCYRLTLRSSSEEPSQARLFQLLALTPSILHSLWTNITVMTVARSFGSVYQPPLYLLTAHPIYPLPSVPFNP